MVTEASGTVISAISCESSRAISPLNSSVSSKTVSSVILTNTDLKLSPLENTTGCEVIPTKSLRPVNQQ